MYRFRYTDFTNEAPVVFSDPTPLANAAKRVATMVDVNVERPVWVYKITHKVSGKSYIGITTRENPRRRWLEHVRAVVKGRRTSKITSAIKKYGKDAFLFDVIYQAINLREACAVERGLIAQYGTLSRRTGWNLSSGGESIPGTEHMDETKAKLSRAVRRYWSNTENREKMIAAFGKRVLPASHIEHLRKQAAAMKGKKRKPESVEKGRQSLMGHFVSQETRARMGAAQRGVPIHTEESKARISQGNRRVWSDPVRKAKILAERAARRLAAKEK